MGEGEFRRFHLTDVAPLQMGPMGRFTELPGEQRVEDDLADVVKQPCHERAFAAHAHRLKLSARAVLDYGIWHGLETISVPVAIAYAANDTLHGKDDIKRVAAVIPEGRAVECPTNTYMHTAAVAAELDHFVKAAG